MVVAIKQLDGTTLSIAVSSTATVRQLKEAIQRERDIPPERQRLIYRAQELKNEGSLLSDYGVINDATLHIVVRPLGSAPPNNYNSNVVVDIPDNHLGEQNANAYMYEGANHDDEGVVVVLNQGEHEDLNILYIVRLCRFVRIFAMMDFIFLVLFGLTLSFLFLIAAVLALAGYYGAKSLRRSFLLSYMVCLLLEMALRGFFMYIDHNVISVIFFCVNYSY